uniref:Uncharacterized protein n=1 Tax=Tetranychus urticae TaxID=32264 RepID=T1JRQ5_TETUR
MLLTLALIKFTLKRIDLPKKRFKHLIKRDDIFLDGTGIIFIDVNHSNNFIGNFKVNLFLFLHVIELLST